ncbi:MAG: hypothetical protein JO314_03240 [Acidobacteria bacterium]|nr:hypothetical protein [Acidobacteriota bacterium]
MSRSSSLIEKLASSAQENPVATALIGGGLIWLLAGRGLATVATGAAAATSRAASDTVRRGSEAVSNVRHAASDLRDSFQSVEAPQAMTASLKTASEIAESGVSRIREGLSYLNPTDTARESFARTHSLLSDLLERQPLVLGAVGVAIGSAIASAFQSTAIEKDLFAPYSENVRRDLAERARAVGQAVTEGVSTLQADLGDAGAEAFDRLKQTSKDALDAAREHVKV